MKIMYIEHVSMIQSKSITDGMRKAYLKHADVCVFDDRATAKKLGKKGMNEALVRAAISFAPDFIHMGKCESVLGTSVKKIKDATGAKIVHFYPDLRYKVQPYVADIGRYVDWTLLQHAGPMIVEMHKDAGCQNVAFWFEGTDPEIYRPHGHPKTYEVVFMANPVGGPGQGNGRFQIVKAVSSAGVRVDIFSDVEWVRVKGMKNVHLHGFVDQERFASSVSKAKIALGYNAGNVRLYTSWRRPLGTMASGCFFLTRYFPGLGSIFKNKKHLVWFRTIPEAVELVKYYMKNDAEREKIAQAGREEVLRAHTWDYRIEEMLTKYGT